MTKNVLFIILFLFSAKAFSQFQSFYICNDCKTSVEVGSTVFLIPAKINPGAYFQLNSGFPLSPGVLDFRGGIQYSYFFSKIEGKKFYSLDTFNINKFGILLNLDFILKKQFILSPGADFSMYSASFDPENLKIAATLEAGYELNDHFTFHTKYTRGFKSIFLQGNEFKINLLNVGCAYAF